MSDLAVNANVKSCAVTDKIGTICLCAHAEGTTTEKSDRDGPKYLAKNEFFAEVLQLLKDGVAYKATGKVDGTCAIITNGKLNKRRDIKNGMKIPPTWVRTGSSERKDHMIGFLSTVVTCPDDKWFIDCHPKTDGVNRDTSRIMSLCLNTDGSGLEYRNVDISSLNNKTVEVMGPMVQSNKHKLKMHCVMEHGLLTLKNFPDLKRHIDLNSPNGTGENLLTDLKNWFLTNEQGRYFEGIVLHFENGKMFKLHRNHLDLKWDSNSTLALDQIKL